MPKSKHYQRVVPPVTSSDEAVEPGTPASKSPSPPRKARRKKKRYRSVLEAQATQLEVEICRTLYLDEIGEEVMGASSLAAYAEERLARSLCRLSCIRKLFGELSEPLRSCILPLATGTDFKSLERCELESVS